MLHGKKRSTDGQGDPIEKISTMDGATAPALFFLLVHSLAVL
jgi:hypothetical protein